MWKEIGVIASVVTALSFIVASVIALIRLRIKKIAQEGFVRQPVRKVFLRF
jgi:hypothetical protein